MNPSSMKQRVVLALVAAVATALSGYMALFQWGWIDHVWDPFFSTDTVLSSQISQDLHRMLYIPDAALGSLSYLGDVILSLVGSKTRWKDQPWLVLLFGLYVIPPAVVSIILVCLQGLVVKSWCFLCLVCAVISLLLIFLSYNEVKATWLYLKKPQP